MPPANAFKLTLTMRRLMCEHKCVSQSSHKQPSKRSITEIKEVILMCRIFIGKFGVNVGMPHNGSPYHLQSSSKFVDGASTLP